MRFIPLIVAALLVFFCLMAIGQMLAPGSSHLLMGNPVSTPAGNPDPSGSDTTYAWWVASDNPLNQTVINWTDRITGRLFHYIGNQSYEPTNWDYGMRFVGSADAGPYFTNLAPLAPGSNMTIAAIFQPGQMTNASTMYAFWGDWATPMSNSIRFYTSDKKWYLPYTKPIALNLPTNNWTDLIVTLSNGCMFSFTNGVFAYSNTYASPPGGGLSLTMLGKNQSSDYVFDGVIKELIVWSNTFSALNVSNLHHYATNTYQYTP